jgi:hypothetical protein
MEKDILLEWLVYTFEDFSSNCCWTDGLELSMFDLAVQGGGIYGKTTMTTETANKILYVARHTGKWVVYNREIVDLSTFLADNNRAMPESLTESTKSIVIGNGVCGLKLTLPAVEMTAQRLGKAFCYGDENYWFIFDKSLYDIAIEQTGYTLPEILGSEFDKVTDQFMVDFFNACEMRNHEIPKRYREVVLVDVAQTLGEGFTVAGYSYKIVKIPSDVEYIISEGEDGSEWIAEKHQVWQ